jgi:hypothetical protein
MKFNLEGLDVVRACARARTNERCGVSRLDGARVEARRRGRDDDDDASRETGRLTETNAAPAARPNERRSTFRMRRFIPNSTRI